MCGCVELVPILRNCKFGMVSGGFHLFQASLLFEAKQRSDSSLYGCFLKFGLCSQIIMSTDQLCIAFSSSVDHLMRACAITNGHVSAVFSQYREEFGVGFPGALVGSMAAYAGFGHPLIRTPIDHCFAGLIGTRHHESVSLGLSRVSWHAGQSKRYNSSVQCQHKWYPVLRGRSFGHDSRRQSGFRPFSQCLDGQPREKPQVVPHQEPSRCLCSSNKQGHQS